MRFIIFSIFIFFVFSSTKAQNFPVGIDSVDIKMKKLKDTLARINYIHEISMGINKGTNKLLPYVTTTLKLSEKLKLEELIADSYIALAKIYYFNPEYKKTVLYLKKAETYYKNTDNYARLLKIYNLLAKAYYYSGFSDFSIYERKKALLLAKKNKDYQNICRHYREIGITYKELGELKLALKYYKKSLEIGLAKDYKHHNAYAYSEIGEIYRIKEDIKKSFEYQTKANEIAYQINEDHPKWLVSLRLANIYLDKNELDSALKYCIPLLNLQKSKLRNNAMLLCAKIYLKEGNLPKAKACIDSSYSFSKKTENFYLLNKVCKVYENLYEKTGDLKSLLNEKNIRISNYDSILRRTNKRKITNIEILTNIDKYEAANNALLKEKKQGEINLRITKIINIALSIIVFLGVFIILGIFYTLRKIKRKSNTIIRQKHEIQAQNEEIKTYNEELSNNNKVLSATINKLKEAQMHLVQAEKMASLGQLTSGIAHEINNPVNFIYTGVNSLEKDFEDIDIVLEKVEKLSPMTENLREEIKKIQKLKDKYYFNDAYSAIKETIKDVKIGAERTAEIVTGLRRFSSGSSGEWIQTDIHEGIDSSLLLLKNKYKDNIEIIKDYQKDLPLIECLPGKINQAFLNIINNAVDAIEGKGTIIIRTKSKENAIFVYIKDSGVGISDELKEHIFEPFFTTKEVGKGVGLGLSITYGIIKDHHGDIMVESGQAQGSEFIIKLPIKQLSNSVET
jgi:signal transduction histidine kinase